MTERPRIVPTPPAEFHARQAALNEAAAKSFADELSTARDDRTRDRVSRKIETHREAAVFHRAEAERLNDRG